MPKYLKPGYVIATVHFDLSTNAVEVVQRYSHEIVALSIPGIQSPNKTPSLTEYIQYQCLSLFKEKQFESSFVYTFDWPAGFNKPRTPQVTGVWGMAPIRVACLDVAVAEEPEFPSPLVDVDPAQPQENDNQSPAQPAQESPSKSE